jgi:hypothetical protein
MFKQNKTDSSVTKLRNRCDIATSKVVPENKMLCSAKRLIFIQIFSKFVDVFPHDLIKQNLNIWLIGLSKSLDVSPIPIKPAQGSGCKSLIPKGYESFYVGVSSW